MPPVMSVSAERVYSAETDRSSHWTCSGVVFSDALEMIGRIRQETGVDIVQDPADLLNRIRLTIAYALNVNDYAGERSAQAVVRDVLIEG